MSSRQQQQTSAILVIDENNVMMFNPGLPNLDREQFGTLQRYASYDEYFEFMYREYFPRIFVMDDQQTIYVASRISMSSGKPYDVYDFDTCHKNALQNQNLVPPFKRQENGGSGVKSDLHWILWCIQHPSYKEMHNDAYASKRVLCNLATTPMPMCDTPPGCAFLCTYQQPHFIPKEPFGPSLIAKINAFCFPGTTIRAIPWFLSFLCRVRFRSTPISFVNFLAMAACLVNPSGYASRVIWVMTGEQKCGKSAGIQFLLSLLSPATTAVTHLDTLTSLFKGGSFNDILMKSVWFVNEGGHQWRETIEDSPHLRTMITEGGPFDVNRKYKDLQSLYGAKTLILGADRFSKPSKERGGVNCDRRIVNIRMGDKPDNPTSQMIVKNAVHIHDYFFSTSDPARSEWLNQFKQHFVDYLSQFSEFIDPSGVDTHPLFRPQDYFATHLAKQTDTDSFRLILQRTNQPTTCTEDIRQAVNAMLSSLACEGTIFPVRHPGVFLNFFYNRNIDVFKSCQRSIAAGDLEYNIMRATWLNDISPWCVKKSSDFNGRYAREGTETLKDLYDEYLAVIHRSMENIFRKTDSTTRLKEQPVTDSTTLESVKPLEDKKHLPEWVQEWEEYPDRRLDRDAVNEIYFRYMLAKFKSCQFIRGSMGFNNAESAWGECFPKRWTKAFTLLLIGMWAAFMKNGCTPPGEGDNYGGSLQTDPKQMEKLATLVTRHIGLSNGFAGGSNIKYVNLFSNLGLPMPGAASKTYENRPSLSQYGPFRILASLVEQSGGEFRPDIGKLESIMNRCKEMFDSHHEERIAHASLVDCVPSAIVEKINKILDHDELYEAVPDKSKLQFEIWDSVFSTEGVCLLTRERFDQSLNQLLVLCTSRSSDSQGDEAASRRKRRRLNTGEFIDSGAGHTESIDVEKEVIDLAKIREEREAEILSSLIEEDWKEKKREEGAVEPFKTPPDTPLDCDTLF